MEYLWSCSVLSTILLTVKQMHGLEVQPSPVATVTEGATLWLTCTYDLEEGTLGQLLWKDKDNTDAAIVSPTSYPQCSAPSDSYSIDCSNLASNEVRLGILIPVHGDTYSCAVYLSNYTQIGPVSTQVSVVDGVDVQPSPVATVTEGATLWLTCTYDLTGGTLGQLLWKDKDKTDVAIVTPTADPPCKVPSGGYNIDCSNLASNEVRMEILNPVHGDTYSCTVILSNFTQIGPVSTQVSVVVPVTSVTFTPPVSDTVTVTPGNSQVYTCVTESCRPAAQIEWYKDDVKITTQTGSVSSTGGDKFVTTSSLTLTGTRGDTTPATVQCRASNVAGMSPVVSTDKTFVVQWAPDGLPVITGYTSVTISYVNDTLPLRCRQPGGNPRATLSWGGVCGRIPPTNSNTQTEAVSDISITVTKDYNQVTCTCMSSHPQPQTQDRTQVTFTVYFGPDNVGITGNRVIVADGTNTLTLTCTTQEYNRHVHITWYNGTSLIPNTAVVTNTSGTYGGYISTQVLQLTPDRYQDGNVIRCVVQNEDVTIGKMTASVTLNLHYRPYLTLTPTPGVNVIEGGELAIRCDVDSNPLSSITWTRVGGQLPSNSDVTSGVLRIPSTHRTDNGTYTCIAQNSFSSEKDSLTIDIYYPPDIRVTYTNTTFTSPDRTFTCVPDGDPDTYQFGKWRHTSEDGTEIRQLTGSSSPTQSVLVLPDPGVTRRYEDTGYYICDASNNIPNSSFYSSGSGFFLVESPPVVNIPTNREIVNGQIGHSVMIAVEFYSRPSVSSSDVTWTRKSMELLPYDAFVTSLGTRTINMPFHEVEIQVKGYVAVLNINELTTEDLGDYTVTIENRVGIKRYTVKVISTGEEDECFSIRVALICVSTVLVVVIVTAAIAIAVLFRMRNTSRNCKKTNQKVDTGQHSRSDNSFFNENNQQSRYEDLNLANISPPSVYEDIQERTQRPPVDTRDGNTYEVLGRTTAPNVYEKLSK